MVLPDREVRFQLISNKIYYSDATYRENSVLLLNIVSKNSEGFRRREYEEAQEARRAMHLLGFLVEQNFENMVCLNMIVNSPVTFDNVKTAKLVLVLISSH